MRGKYRVLVRKTEGKRPLGRPSRRLNDNIKMDLQEVWCRGMEWIELAEDWDRWRALVNALLDLRVLYNAGNFMTSWDPVSFSRRTLLFGVFNPLTPNDPYRGRTAPLTSYRCILYIYSTNIGTEYFKHGIYSPFFSFKMQFVS